MTKLDFTSNKKIALVYRGEKPQALSLAKTISHWLRENDYKVYTAPGQKKIAGTLLASPAAMMEMKLVIALGGDGTYLRAIRILKGLPTPILGVNLGSLGFLTPISADEALSAVERTLQNQMVLEPRAILDVDLQHKGKKSKSKKDQILALNDIVIERGQLSQLINIGIFHDRHLLSEVKADGLIISSPTGSTAYNLAAGGPILHPKVKALVVTPIAPHSLNNRPLIMPDDGRLSFCLVGRAQKAHLVVDGQKIAEIENDDEVIIQRNKRDHLMVTDKDHDYFRLLREKLKFGDRT